VALKLRVDSTSLSIKIAIERARDDPGVERACIVKSPEVLSV
jgi:hypothetical protein